MASDSLTHSQCGLPALANTLRTEPLRLSWTANLTGFMPYSLAPHRRSMLVRTGPSHRAVVWAYAPTSALSLPLWRPSCHAAENSGSDGVAGIGEAAAQAHKQPKRLRYAMGLSMVAPNGEVEGPADHAGQAPRAHTVPKRPRRQTVHASRTPPTIVRSRSGQVANGRKSKPQGG